MDCHGVQTSGYKKKNANKILEKWADQLRFQKYVNGSPLPKGILTKASIEVKMDQ